ncbi:hypothetical protein BDN72DRAFT_849989 [Pluteus cervinus]|uniref:Uncharacterized protein n=1 Tax=Pluteus cervinus TaxID=181527 RepID=A0ACD3A5T8_9AGAR|nr:hypothetical protein BDN72DRAFT_849989 [Pluteus cervinus]
MEHLPVEIIHEIAAYISHRDVFNLAQLSCYLNSVLIPYFFTTCHHIPDPSRSKRVTMRLSCYAMTRRIENPWGKQSQLGEGWKDVLSGLTIAFGLRELDSLECTFTCSSSHDHNDWDVANYRRLLLALKRLDRVRKLTLVMDHSNVFAPHKERALITMGNRQETTNELLNMCLERGCEGLVVQDSSFLPMAPTRRQMTYARILRRFWPSSSVWLTAPFSRICKPIFLPLTTRKASKLVHLQISSLILLWPPFSTWTYDVLGTPSLMSLKLHKVYLEPELWEFVLSWLVQPTRTRLLKLAVGDCNIPATTLVEFIIKLEALTHLTLSEYLRNPDEGSVKRLRANAHFFPHLISLTAPLNWVRYILNLVGPKSKAKFNYLGIIPPSTFLLEAFTSDLKVLLDTLSHPSRRGPNAHLDVSLDLSHGQYPLDVFQEDFDSYSNLDLALNERGIKAFASYDAITELRLPVDMMDQESEVLGRFLGRWNHLKLVTFCDPFERTERWATLWGQKPRDVRKEAVVQKLLACTKTFCPSVEVEVGLDGLER